ncbi:MAG: flagellar hook-length control protein FliK, partial [Bdellovibrionales bacterium]|nr:flagellar hook-length control protein FliK [Bdellovibrionales bacterium]
MTIGGIGAFEGFDRFELNKNMTSARSKGDVEASISASASPVESSRKVATSNESGKSGDGFSSVLKKSNRTVQEDVAGAAGVASSSPSQVNQSSAVNEAPYQSNASVKSVGGSREALDGATRVDNAVGVEIGSDNSDIKRSLKQFEVGDLLARQEALSSQIGSSEKALSRFLNRMQSEFGVQPDEVVKAFANLDQATLAAPPEKTVEAVLSQLLLESKLQPQQIEKAESIYLDMLKETAPTALNEAVGGVVSFEVATEREVADVKLQDSLARLNDRFAMRDQETKTADTKAARQAHLDDQSKFPAFEIEAGQEDNRPRLETSETEKSGEVSNLAQSLSAALTEIVSQAEPSKDATNSEQGSGRHPRAQKTLGLDSLEAALKSIPVGNANGFEKIEAPVLAMTATSEAMANNGVADEAVEAKDLIHHARLLLKDGGGEMRMQLKPEGVGHVHMKVAIQDGQVAIQLMTESDSAKRMLESNLDELKTALAQHKLHVDALKIEVGSEFADLAKQRFEQSQQDTNREQARHMAQDFMGQFRQDRESFRGMFAENQGIRGYRQNRAAETPAMEEVTASKARGAAGSSRRLDLVA